MSCHDFPMARALELLRLLDMRAYDRGELAERLGMSLPSLARTLAMLRSAFGMAIVFTVCKRDKQDKHPRLGRRGFMEIRKWGELDRDLVIGLSKAISEQAASAQNENYPETVGLIRFFFNSRNAALMSRRKSEGLAAHSKEMRTVRKGFA